jgi:hypothetical protein
METRELVIAIITIIVLCVVWVALAVVAEGAGYQIDWPTVIAIITATM